MEGGERLISRVDAVVVFPPVMLRQKQMCGSGHGCRVSVSEGNGLVVVVGAVLLCWLVDGIVSRQCEWLSVTGDTGSGGLN